MRKPALRAENSETGGESGAFVADSCCRPRGARAKVFENKDLVSCS
ncbi:hypothetical protein [Bradyrhizobium lablabi]|nr:hypothetical protein [Bradyrhizobium lablabi]